MTGRKPAAGGEADHSLPAGSEPGHAQSGAARARRQSFGADLLTELFINPLDPGYRDAAAKKATKAAEAPSSLARRLAARSGAVVVLVAFGVLLSVAYQQVVAEAPEAARARAQLLDEVARAEKQSKTLQGRADRLRADVARARDRALAGAGSDEEAQRLRDMEAATGVAEVSGPGVAVTVSDGPRETDPVTGEPVGDDLGRVLDRDLQRLVNGLWAAGAEAVSIDKRRLSPVSTIRAAGEAIRVDFIPVSSPYVVRAIGPPQMRGAFASSRAAEQFRWLHDKYQMGFLVAERDALTLSAASDPQLRHAKPATPGGPRPSPSSTGGD